MHAGSETVKAIALDVKHLRVRVETEMERDQEPHILVLLDGVLDKLDAAEHECCAAVGRLALDEAG